MGYTFRRSTCIQVGLAGLLSGLIAAKFGYSASLQLILIGFALLPLLLRLKFPAIAAVGIIGLSLGLWRGADVHGQFKNYNQFIDTKTTLVGTVSSDAAYEEKGQLEFLITDITEKESGVYLPGTVQVRAYGVRSLERSDVVEVTARLRGPFGSRQGYMSYATVVVTSRSSAALEETRAQFIAGTYSTLSEPHASLGLGFLIGTRSLLPETLTTALSVTGLTHIVAVSGYNLTILVRLMRRVFARRSAFVATASAIALIVSFILVTGMSPSIARASVVSFLALIAWYYGRSVKPTMLLLVAAALTAFINPLYAWHDIGWYLSFAAFVGVLILAPLVQARWFKRKPKLIGQLVLETTCAQLATLPIIVVVFGQISLISILANLLVLPFIPFAMIGTFIAGIAGMFAPAVAGWFAFPAELILRYIVSVIQAMASVPWAQLDEVLLPMSTLWLFYALLLFVIVILYLRSGSKMPNAVRSIE